MHTHTEEAKKYIKNTINRNILSNRQKMVKKLSETAKFKKLIIAEKLKIIYNYLLFSSF